MGRLRERYENFGKEFVLTEFIHADRHSGNNHQRSKSLGSLHNRGEKINLNRFSIFCQIDAQRCETALGNSKRDSM